MNSLSRVVPTRQMGELTRILVVMSLVFNAAIPVAARSASGYSQPENIQGDKIRASETTKDKKDAPGKQGERPQAKPPGGGSTAPAKSIASIKPIFGKATPVRATIKPSKAIVTRINTSARASITPKKTESAPEVMWPNTAIAETVTEEESEAEDDSEESESAQEKATPAYEQEADKGVHDGAGQTKLEPIVTGPLNQTTPSITLSLLQRLEASDPANSVNFGRGVAIDGDIAVIGAASATNSSGLNTGAVYVFGRNDDRNWVQLQKLTPTSAIDGEALGNSVAISNNTIVIGSANAKNSAGLAVGAVYIYERDGTTWVHSRTIRGADNGTASGFGTRVRIQRDTLVVSTNLENSVYVFARSGGGWPIQQKITESEVDRFGRFGVALSGDTLAVTDERGTVTVNTQGSVYVYTRSGTTWTGPVSKE